MRGVESEGSLDLEDIDDLAEILGAEEDSGSGVAISDEPEAKTDVEGDVEAEPEIEEDDDLLEPDFEKLGRPVRRFEQEDNELEALIDADFDAEDEDELEILMLQELGIEIGDDHDVSFSSIAAEPNETDGFDDDMAA